MTHPYRKRKGARWLDIGQERWSYFVGKKFVEVRDPANKATLIPRARLDEWISAYPDDPHMEEAAVTLPGAVARYIKANLRG